MVIRETNRLNLDLSSLTQPVAQEGLVIRFKDISGQKMIQLAERVKATSPIYSIRKTEGPTVEKILEALEIMNPIIFAEGRGYTGARAYRGFGSTRHYSITGWIYRKLCKAIYLITCIKRPLRRGDVQLIIGLTSFDWIRNEAFLNDNFVERTEGENNTIRIEEIGLEEMERIRTNADYNGANNIPQGLLDRGTTEEGTMWELPSTMTFRADLARVSDDLQIRVGPFSVGTA